MYNNLMMYAGGWQTMCDVCVYQYNSISKKKYNSYFIWLWSQVQKWYTLLGKKLDFAYQKNGKNGKKTYYY